MEELIFFGIIILFSILESVARRRKAKQKQTEGGADEPVQFEWAQTPPREADLPTYDEDPSYDDRHEEEGPLEGPRIAGGRSADPQPSAADIWAEIAGLARETPPPPTSAPPVPAGRSEASRSEAVTRAEALSRSRDREVARSRDVTRSRDVSRSRAVSGPVPEHRVHLSHAGYGTDPSSRAPSEQDGMDPLLERLGADAAAVRAQLMSDDPSALRRAVILHQILGPPVALRGDPRDG